jgi:hypothetical protein
MWVSLSISGDVNICSSCYLHDGECTLCLYDLAAHFYKITCHIPVCLVHSFLNNHVIKHVHMGVSYNQNHVEV